MVVTMMIAMDDYIDDMSNGTGSGEDGHAVNSEACTCARARVHTYLVGRLSGILKAMNKCRVELAKSSSLGTTSIAFELLGREHGPIATALLVTVAPHGVQGRAPTLVVALVPKVLRANVNAPQLVG